MSASQPGSQPALQPTFRGYVRTTKDALLLFEACLSGQINHVPRRPHDRERQSLIDSGNVFIYEEQSSGIKRWTDGITWSPSRILGNFLVYRELEKPFPPGEKKRAMKRGNRPRPTSGGRPGEPYMKPGAGYSPESVSASTVSGPSQQSEAERELFGSLVDSYGFKENGLVKKTMSVTVNGVTHHLVSYYTVSHVLKNQDLQLPSTVFHSLPIREELWKNQSFRSPPEESLEPGMDAYTAGYPGGYRDQMSSQAPLSMHTSSAASGYYTLPAAYSNHHQPQMAAHHPSLTAHHPALQPHHHAAHLHPQQQSPSSHRPLTHHSQLPPHHQQQAQQQHQQQQQQQQPPIQHHQPHHPHYSMSSQTPLGQHHQPLSHPQSMRQQQPLQYQPVGQQRVDWGMPQQTW